MGPVGVKKVGIEEYFVDVVPLRGMPSHHISQVAYFAFTDFLNKSHKYHWYDITACPHGNRS